VTEGLPINAALFNMDGQDGQDKEEMMNDECGMMNEKKAVFCLSFIIRLPSCLSCPSMLIEACA
jgi:hypothetical protein